MGYVIGLTVALVLLWLGLSGYYDKPLILGLGVVSIALSVGLTTRLGIIDRESSPYHRFFGFLTYTPWLFGEILKSNFVVIRACLSPDLKICPTLVKVPTTCRSDLAKVVFANSISLTPGTVTVRVDDRTMLVHGLYETEAQPEAFKEMDMRASRAADGRRMLPAAPKVKPKQAPARGAKT